METSKGTLEDLNGQDFTPKECKTPSIPYPLVALMREPEKGQSLLPSY